MQTRMVEGANHVFEIVVRQELIGLTREFVPIAMDMLSLGGEARMIDRLPILFLSDKYFAILGESWRYR